MCVWQQWWWSKSTALIRALWTDGHLWHPYTIPPSPSQPQSPLTAPSPLPPNPPTHTHTRTHTNTRTRTGLCVPLHVLLLGGEEHPRVGKEPRHRVGGVDGADHARKAAGLDHAVALIVCLEGGACAEGARWSGVCTYAASLLIPPLCLSSPTQPAQPNPAHHLSPNPDTSSEPKATYHRHTTGSHRYASQMPR